MQKKNALKHIQTAYQIYINNKEDLNYPLLLCNFLLASKSQFEKTRSIKLILDWIINYRSMDQMAKHKYLPIIPKVLKSLLNLFVAEEDMYVCHAAFYYDFYNIWPEFTEVIQHNLSKTHRYTLKFLWYISFDFCEKLASSKQWELGLFLAENFQEPLRKYKKEDIISFKPLLQTVRMFNIQKAKKQFIDNSEQWIEKMEFYYKAFTEQNTQTEILIEIIGCRSFLIQSKKSKQYWLSKVDKYFMLIESLITKLTLKNQTHMKLIDSLPLIIGFKQVKQFMIINKKRFLLSLIGNMKKSPEPSNPFYYEKFYSLRHKLVSFFFLENMQQSMKELTQILDMFNRKHYNVLNSEENQILIDCMCDQNLEIEISYILEIIKSLSSSHMRKTFTVQVLITLVRLLQSASHLKLSEESISSIIKSLSESIASKINDPKISVLRFQITKYYLTLATQYQWNDQRTTEIMLIWCEEFEKNNKVSCPQSINMLRILTKKYTAIVFSSFLHKMESLISDIALKLNHNKSYQNAPNFVSLLICLYTNLNWEYSHKYIKEVCSSNPENITCVYLLQSQIITQSGLKLKQVQAAEVKKQQIQQIASIFKLKELWHSQPRINVYLLYIEMFFAKISKQQAYELLMFIDNHLLALFEMLYEDASYHLLTHLAARVFPWVGSLSKLKKLKSFKHFKGLSFEILSRSFHKKSIILMSYMYCSLLLRIENLESDYLELNQDKFMNSLFQGCNDFIGKSNQFWQEICYIILLYSRVKQKVQICGRSNILSLKQFEKNKLWWEETSYRVCFNLPSDEKHDTHLIKEFKEYYENYIRKYFENETNPPEQNEKLEEHGKDYMDYEGDYL